VSVLRSLWRHLVVPWAISAAILVPLTLLVLGLGLFGLVAWAGLFVAFVFACNLHRDAVLWAREHALDAQLDEAALLAKYGITREGDAYRYRGAAYHDRNHALSIARTGYLQRGSRPEAAT
jgi:hypothetical protein